MAEPFDFASIIVSTYNRPDALELVLLALDVQSVDVFEVVVADDGSSSETAEMIERVKKRVSYRLGHAWQADDGFRAARARNLAVAHSRGDYLIFLDGDCIPPRDFVESHRWLAEIGWWVRGNRVNLTQRFTNWVLAEALDITNKPLWWWMVARVVGNVVRATPFLRFRTHALRKLSPREWIGGKTCNLGIWRDDFMLVDGLDESYVGWGREDSDLVARLINAGIYRKEGRYAMPVMHLWHPAEPLSSWEANDKRLKEVLESGITQPRLGISAHSAEGS